MMAVELRFAPYQIVNVARVKTGDQYKSHILTKVGDTILVDRPKYKTRAGSWRYFDSVYVNNLLYLSYEHSGVKYEFKTSVLKVSYVPFYHLCLKLPDDREIKTENIWSSPRYNGFVPVTLTAMHKDGYSVLLAERSFMVDIGPRGVGIVSESKISRNFLLEMNVTAECRLQIKCKVKNVKSDLVDGFFYYGCEIEQVSEPERFSEYLNFLSAATDFFTYIPSDVGSDDFSFFNFA
ncbi:MAG: flagellar brake domain-containing protein [Deltaproteobacteria bacterium]|nr:flagellar brake domain-containing protein [Candidatus Tharpella aukensis]